MGPQIEKLGPENLGCLITLRSLNFLWAQGVANEVQRQGNSGLVKCKRSGSLVNDHSKWTFKAGSLFFLRGDGLTTGNVQGMSMAVPTSELWGVRL